MQVFVDNDRLIASGSVFINVDSEIILRNVNDIEYIAIKFKFIDGRTVEVEKKYENGRMELVIITDTEQATFGFANYKLTESVSMSLYVKYLTNTLLKFEYTFLEIVQG